MMTRESYRVTYVTNSGNNSSNYQHFKEFSSLKEAQDFIDYINVCDELLKDTKKFGVLAQNGVYAFDNLFKVILEKYTLESV